MADALESLKSQLGALPDQDRAELARFLIDSLEAQSDADAETAWETELAHRVAEIRAGRVVGKPAEQVFAELCERFP
jgi:putative addiction module component (TIGR02574 family)